MLRLFFDASNMKENFSKRDKLGLGPRANLTPRQLPGYTWCPVKRDFINNTWTTSGRWLISLGIPIGNNFSVSEFLTGKYLQAKAALVRASVGAATPIGRHKIVNANF